MGLWGRAVFVALLAAGLLLQLAEACFSPADVYAVEVLLNKPGVEYDLSKLTGVKEIEYARDTSYAYRSRFDTRLIVVLSEQSLNGEAKRLAVRVQVPVAWREITTYSCSIPLPCYKDLREDVSLTLQPGEGTAELALGKLTFTSGCYSRFKPELSASVGENASLVVSGSLLLRRVEGDLEYRISMPCLLSIGEGCARILVVIPGFDAPMLVKPGTYEATLTLSWRASAQTVLIVKKLNLSCGCAPWMPLPRELRWEFEEGVLTKRIGEAIARVRSSDGFCEVSVEGAANLSEVKVELEELFEAIGIGRELAQKCDFVGSTDLRLAPSEQISLDEVKAALKAELEWLVENKVVTGLKPEDITLIAAAAKLGYAGWNQRLVWYEGDWTPYSSTPNATLVRCVTGVLPEFAAGTDEYISLGEASVGKEVPHGYLNLIAVTAAVAASAVALYAVVRRKLHPRTLRLGSHSDP